MRIAYICADPGIPVFGCKGASIHVQSVIRELLRLGHEVELFATRLGGEPPSDLQAVSIHPLPTLPKGIGLEAQQAREQAALSANLELRIALENAPALDLIYERYSLWSYTGMELARQQQIPGVLEVNAPLIAEQTAHRGLILESRAEWVASQAFGAATVLVAVSEDVAAYLHRFPSTQGRVHVVPNGVDPTRFLREPLGARPDPRFTVGFVGTMKPWHDLPTLLQAFASFHQDVPQSRLLLIGDGPLLVPMQSLAATLGIGAVVEFTGAVPPEQIPGYLAAMDVAIAPYGADQACYFSPLKVYEYMAARLPVIGSAVGQLKTVITEEQTGCLYAPGQAEALRTALLNLACQPELRQKLGDKARHQVEHHHSWQRVVQTILQLALSQQTLEVVH
jgi:glycosyltransferase involved in cell wall biosynthesis